ncbi:MAG: 1-acyl-sn-glycerol-3-phosphate acyltransferase [Alphaproteobacteria bacterium]|nr:1-acyl-sn-glycerol-3-phosphate acyltransferase [Alphaproteobacteria bacterium]
MLYFRSFVFTVLFFAWAAVASLVSVLLLPFPGRAMRWLARVWAKVVNILLRVVCGIKMQNQINAALLPPRPYIMAVKHQSAWETMVMHLVAPKPATIVKKGLAQIPFFGWAVMRAGSIALDRGAGSKAMRHLLDQAQKRAKKKYTLVVYPEGTRTPYGKRVESYQPGVALLYDKLRLPVVPIVLNSGKLWGKNSWIKRPGTITIKNLPPIMPGIEKREFMKRLNKEMEDGCEALG